MSDEKRVGRPKGAPTKVTTLNMPECAALSLSNGERVAKIEAWLDTVDLHLIVRRAAGWIARKAELGYYVPIKFQIGGSEGTEVSKPNMGKQISLRMPVALHDRVIAASDILANRPSDVLRLALLDRLLDNAELLEGANYPHEIGLEIGVPPQRKNSTQRLRYEREQCLKQSRDPELSDEDRAYWLAKALAIKA